MARNGTRSNTGRRSRGRGPIQLAHALREGALVEVEQTIRLRKTLHETAEDFAAIGLIDAQTMRAFDAACLPPVKDDTGLQIKRLRLRCRSSQAVFAACLNTSPSTVRKWERGDKHPHGPSLKLLNRVERKGLEALI